ncbi:MAG: lipocalin-like domain-containing protein [Candidatus Latescibacteria bacterium]|nr:lipocalin-like domain-containing protein [Candidatus Latescibacterota bacterium]
MRHLIAMMLMSVYGIALLSCGQRGGAGVEGVWMMTSVAVTAPDTTATLDTPGTGILILHNGHYSQVWMDANRRYSIPPSDLEKVDAYDTFDASAGTYTLADSTLTLTPQVARDPSAVGVPSTTIIQLTGETLVRRAERPDRNDPTKAMQWTSTYTRATPR